MLRFLAANLRHRPSRAVAFGAAILVAAVSFVLLTSAAKTSDLRVRGSVTQNFRNAYDILVRPRGSFTKIERESGLVQANYLSGIFGGITLRQYGEVKQIRGVQVAAPIANVGYIFPFVNKAVLIDDLVSGAPAQMFRLKQSYVAQRGLSRYPANDWYVYYTTRDRLLYDQGGLHQVLPDGRMADVCKSFANEIPSEGGPFRRPSYMSCYSRRSPGEDSSAYNSDFPVGRPSAVIGFYFPVLLAAIDPVQEARLTNLDRTITAGRFLKPHERPRVGRFGGNFVPIIASARPYLDEHLSIEVSRLPVLPATPFALRVGGPDAYRFVTHLPAGKLLATKRVSLVRAYERLLRSRLFSDIYWTPSNVRYRRATGGRLSAITTANPESIWKSHIYTGGYFAPPHDNADAQFRRLYAYNGRNTFDNRGVYRTPAFRLRGRYDPAKLPGFSPLSRLPMETYYPPLVEGGDARSRRLLKGKPLLPTQNVGDYIQQPPLFLTTLEGMRPFLNPEFFPGASARAPISVIRIRVANVKGPDPESRARIKAVALEIRDRTGLDVDITAGSSPRELLIDLPAGKFGRPELLLKEGWVKKGVSVTFLKALDRKRLLLLALIPLTCGFFLINGAFAAARARRRELGTLLCLGWPRRAIFTALLGELALVGLVAGLLGTAVAAAIVEGFSLDVSLARTLLVVPLALVLPMLAGLVPALRASREAPLAAVAPPVVASTSVRSVRNLHGLVLANLARVPQRTLVGVLGMVVGVAALTLIVGIDHAFQGTLVGTLLGDAILFRISGLDFVALGVTIALAACSLADVLFLNLSERSAELVTLRTLGWRQRHLARVVALEAVGMGLIGALGGALLGLALGAALGISLLPLLAAAGLAGAGGLLVSLVVSLLPLTRVAGLTAPVVLAEE